MNIARFEGDSGKAAGIVTRDSERMSRAAFAAEAALRKEADQAGRTKSEFLALQAAKAGLPESAQRLAEAIGRADAAINAAGKGGAAAFKLFGGEAEAAAQRATASNAELVRSILQVNEAYRARRQVFIAREAEGTIDPSKLKKDLAALEVLRKQSVERLEIEHLNQRTAQETANVEQASAQKRIDAIQRLRDAVAKSNFAVSSRVAEKETADLQKRIEATQRLRDVIAKTNLARDTAKMQEEITAAQRMIDTQNGLTATYREQLLAIKKLQAAGAITPAVAKVAGAELVSRQPVFQSQQARLEQEAAAARARAELAQTLTRQLGDAQVAADERRKASVQSFIDKLREQEVAYERLRAAIREQAREGRVQPVQANVSGQKIAQQDIAATVALRREVELTAATDLKLAAERLTFAQRLTDAQKGLTATFRDQARELREAKASGAISAEVFKEGRADLLSRQPIFQQRKAQREAEQTAERNRAELAQVLAKQIADAEVAGHDRQKASIATLIARLREQEEAVKRNLALVREQRREGTVSPLQASGNAAKIAQQDIVATQALRREVEQTAAIAAKLDAERLSSAQRLTDAERGLTATFREQLRGLLELKAVGAIKEPVFQRARTDLVSSQPIVKQRKEQLEAEAAADRARAELAQTLAKQIADAEVAGNERRKASVASFIERLAEQEAATRRQFALAQEEKRAGVSTPLQASGAAAKIAQADIAATQALRREAEATAATEAKLTAARIVDAQRLIDVQRGLPAGLRDQLRALRDLQQAGALTPVQRRQAAREQIESAPVVREARAIREAIAQTEQAFVQAQAASKALADADVGNSERRKVAVQEFIGRLQAVQDEYRQTQQLQKQQLAAGAITKPEARAGVLRAGEIAQENAKQIIAAANQVRVAEERRTQDEIVATQRLVDNANGLTATYRAQLASLKALRDAGRITPERFREEGKDLVGRNPVVQRAKAEADAAAAAERAFAQVAVASKALADSDIGNTERRKAAAQEFITRLYAVQEEYRKTQELLRQQVSTGALSKPEASDAAVRASQVAQANAAKITAAAHQADEAEKQRTQEQIVATQRLIDTQNGLLATYRPQIAALKELRDAGLSAERFQQAKAELAARNPAVQRAKETAEAIAATEKAFASAAAASKALADADVGNSERRKTAANEYTTRLIAQQEEFRKAIDLERQQAGPGPHRRPEFAQGVSRVSAAAQEEAAKIEAAANQVIASEQKKAAAVKAAGDALILSLERQLNALGKQPSQLAAMDAAMLGVSNRAAPLIAKLGEAEKNLNKFGKTSGVARYQLQTLQYTVSDTVASLASGISPMTILLQQGGQVLDVFGSVGNVFRSIGSLFTVARVAMGGLAAAVGTVAYAMYQGAKQTKEFNDAIVLSGNYAGQTAGQFLAATRSIAESGEISVAAAREYGQALIATGQIGPQVFKAAQEAAARFGAATGKNAKDVAADFASMGQDVVKWATDHNQQLNFVTAAQIQHIRKLQEQGKVVEAQQQVYDLLNQRFRGLEDNLGSLDKLLRVVSTSWASFWDRAFDVGRPETIEQKIENARRAAEKARDFAVRSAAGLVDQNERVTVGGGNRPDGTVTRRPGTDANAVEDAQELVRILQRSQATQQLTALEGARLKELNKQVLVDDAITKSYREQAKLISERDRLIDEQKARFARQDELKAKDSTYKVPDSDADRKRIIAQIEERFTNKSGASAAKALQKSALDEDLKEIQNRFAAQALALRFNQQQLQAEYQAGNLSVVDYFEKRRINTADGLAKELDELKEGRIRIERELVELRKRPATDENKTEINRVQIKLNDNRALRTKTQAEADNAVIIANTEQTESYRQLSERISEFRAQLAQLTGDEVRAAEIRTKLTVDQAKRQQTVTRGLPGAPTDEDIIRLQKATEAQAAFAELQRKTQIAATNAARAEEAYTLRAEQEGLTLSEVERGIYQIRAASLVQLGELAEATKRLAKEQPNNRELQQAAADLALTYAKAADAVDPFFNRLRDSGRDLAQSLADDLLLPLNQFVKLEDYAKNIGRTIYDFVIKSFVTQPLTKALEGYINSAVKLLANTAATGGAAASGSDIAGGATQGIAAGAAAAAETIAADTAAASAAAGLATAQGLLSSATNGAISPILLLSNAANAAALALSRVAGSQGVEDIDWGALAGLLTGAGAGAGGGATYSSVGVGMPGYMLSTGTNYVPYDGFRAVLHKGESVVPAKYNPAAGNSGSRVNVIVNAPPGSMVDRTEERETSDGREIVLFMSQNERWMAGNVTRGRSPLNQALKQRGVNTSRNLPKRG